MYCPDSARPECLHRNPFRLSLLNVHLEIPLSRPFMFVSSLTLDEKGRLPQVAEGLKGHIHMDGEDV